MVPLTARSVVELQGMGINIRGVATSARLQPAF